jgi:hypothetical protein
MAQCKFCKTDNLDWKQIDEKWSLFLADGSKHDSYDCKRIANSNEWHEKNKDVVRPVLKIGDVVQHVDNYSVSGVVEIISRPKEEDKTKLIWQRGSRRGGKWVTVVVYRKGDRRVKVKWEYPERWVGTLNDWISDRNLMLIEKEEK